MSPKAFAAALRDFAAAVALSPDPAKGVADLALLIAQSVDENFADYESQQARPLDHDEEAFPPLAGSDAEATAALRLYQDTGPEVAAFNASGLSLADWAALPDCDRAHHIAVHQQLAAKAAETDSPAA